MNQHGNPTDDDRRFDRLVDGEMSGSARRQLLESLDDEPGGWRRCALAFLEAQACSESIQLRHLLSDELLSDETDVNPWQSAKHPATSETVITPMRSERLTSNGRDGAELFRSGRGKLVLGLAACIAIAFFLGTEFRQRWPRHRVNPEPLTQQRWQSVDPATDMAPEEEVLQPDEHPDPPKVEPWGEATFVMGEEGREVDVPVYDLDPYARQALLEHSTAAIDTFRDELQRGGFDVQNEVRWSPIEMGSGQTMLLPIGDFVISPVSHRSVQ